MKVTVNGSTIEVPDGSSVSVSGGNVVINGRNSFTYTEQVKVDIHGNCGTVRTASGDVTVSGDVHGSVTTMSGDVRSGRIIGNVTTMSGDITR